MQRRMRIVIPVLLMTLLLLCSSCSLFPYSNEEPAPTLFIPKPISYETTEVIRGDLKVAAEGYGTLRSMRYVKHYFTHNQDRIQEFCVKLGDEVQEGQALVRLMNGKELLAKVSGKVAYINAEYATGLSMNQPVPEGVTLVAIDEQKVEDLYLVFSRFNATPPNDFPVGLTLTLRKMNATEQFEGVVVSSSSVVEDMGSDVSVQSNELYCKLIAPPEGLVSGDSLHYEYVQAQIQDCLILPIYAYHVNELGQKYVYVLDENNLKRERFIEIGLSTLTQVEVLSGLKEGELVVLS